MSSMIWSLLLTLLLAGSSHGKAVFAHFMIGNTGNYTDSDIKDDISKAQEAHIDAFALNIANGDPINKESIPRFFDQADALGFHLFFSFDYAGNGPWSMNDVINLISTYSGRDSYYRHQGKPLVSTFEGPGSSDDWLAIKQRTGCFFIPDWSSLGAKPALQLGTADGLFNWAAWPWGPQEMNTYVDASYIEYLDGLPYMMPAAPWFYTNLPGYNKNWLWRGDNLWYDRWQEILFVKPDFVEIISWNDYGESHYIGPLREHAMEAFNIGRAPYNYATNMPHDGWRLFLPFLIDTYKSGTAKVDREGLTVWHRPQPAAACSSGGTSGNTASQLQIEFPPTEIVQDHIFFSALLGSPATVTVSVGGVALQASWTWQPEGDVGIYHGSVPFGSHLGDVVVTLQRDGKQLVQVQGSSISTDCVQGLTNWNAWVGSSRGSESVNVKPGLSLFKQECINGTGTNNFAGLCEFACSYGYCPIGACYCQQQGEAKMKPNATGPTGYPADGKSASYSGLCAFDCPLGYCPQAACGTISAPLSTPTVSEFLPPACIAGTGEGNLAGLCSFACNLGHCPIAVCTCTAHGALHTLPEATGDVGVAAPGLDEAIYTDLCAFTCMYGYCPEGACVKAGDSGDDSDGGSGSGDVYIDPIIFAEPSPIVECIPPCNLIFPEQILPTPTTIYLYPLTTSFTVGGSIVTTTLHPSPITTSTIQYFNMPVHAGQTNPFSFYMTPSYLPSPIVVSAGDETRTVFLPPATVQSYRGDDGPGPFYSLNSTYYIVNDQTYTYSEAQFPSLSDLPTPTVSTTTVPARNSDATTTSTDTPVPLWIQAGGFYWSRVPEPTPPPGADSNPPSLPSFPPVPDLPCFQLGDLFSINCPPDRSFPTTRWSSHQPRTTCTDTNSPGCGHRCTSNCGGDSTSTESCTKDTATNYWVSCSSTTCETTKSRTFTGCSVTDSTTTTGQYCPTGVAIDPDADQGATPYAISGGAATPTTTVISTSFAEIAVIGGHPYTATSGAVTLSHGQTISVPPLNGPTQVGGNEVTTTIDGLSMVLIPPSSGLITVPVVPTAPPDTGSGSNGNKPPSNDGGYAAHFHLIFAKYYALQGHPESYTYWGWYAYADEDDASSGLCAAHPTWVRHVEDDYNGEGPGETVQDMSVFGDTCTYTETSAWAHTEVGAVVGKLKCDKYDDAICQKQGWRPVECATTRLGDLLKCFWR